MLQNGVHHPPAAHFIGASLVVSMHLADIKRLFPQAPHVFYLVACHLTCLNCPPRKQQLGEGEAGI